MRAPVRRQLQQATGAAECMAAQEGVDQRTKTLVHREKISKELGVFNLDFKVKKSE